MSRQFTGRRAALFLGLGGAALALAIGLVLTGRPHRPNVVVIVADTLRADRLGAYGDGRGLTPFLDGLAARGVVFRHAYATSSWTCPSVASLFTSRYPSQHHVTDFEARLPEAEVTLAERLAAAGYMAAGFSANWLLTADLGYAQGFQHFPTFPSGRKVTTDRLGRKSLHWLDRMWSPPGGPLFLYYQLMETHSPYAPVCESHDTRELPLQRRLGLRAGNCDRTAAVNARLTGLRWQELTAWEASFLESLYDEEAALLDARLRRLFAELERHGILDGAIVVFAADHGEEFRDHGLLLHGTSLFNELIHVPLILVLPGRSGGVVVDENVSLVDVAPTLLELLGLPPEPRFEGVSLMPVLAGARHPDVVAEYLPTESIAGSGRHSLALVRGSIKLIVPRDGPPDPVLYDVAADPYESRPDPPELSGRKAAYFEAAQRTVAALASRAGAAERKVVDERTRERLRALGYAN